MHRVRSAIVVPVGLLAGGGVAVGVRVRGAHEPGRHLLHGVLHAASLHDAASSRRAAAGRPRRHAPLRHAARDAEDVRLPHGTPPPAHQPTNPPHYHTLVLSL